MSGPAKVMSIDAVARLSTAVRRFSAEANGAIEAIGLEVHRALEYFQLDRRDYWTHEVRRGWDRVSEARINLERRQIMTVAGHRPSCDEEKKAFEKAKRRLHVAEEKIELVRRWARVLEHEVIEYRGSVGPLTGWLQLDQAKAVALLDRLSRALEAYVAVKGLAVESGAAPSVSGSGSGGSESPAPGDGTANSSAGGISPSQESQA